MILAILVHSKEEGIFLTGTAVSRGLEGQIGWHGGHQADIYGRR